jgi:transcriptional regulator with XRE-family HTH domain
MTKTKYSQTIKGIREARGITQDEMAKKLGMSRPTYIAVEKGKRELTVSEFDVLSKVLGVSMEELELGVIANFEKYKQMILMYVRNSGKEGVRRTKLAKLVYLADFAWFYHHLESMSGMLYRRLQYGPVPDGYFRALLELEEEGKITVTTKEEDDKVSYTYHESSSNRAQKLTAVSEEEERLMNKIFANWKDKRGIELVNFTHNQLPWAICHENEIIPYALITQEDPDNIY